MEIWKSVLGYEGLYEVSNKGRVKSNIRDIVDKNGVYKYYDEIILQVYIPKNSYPQVTLYKNNEKKTVNVHVLIVEAFLKKESHHDEVNHIDEDKSNNLLENLEWVTRKENDNHGTRNIRISQTLSKKTYQYDLDGNLMKIWNSTMDAERVGGFSSKLISMVCLNKRKTHKGYRWSYEETLGYM